MIEPDGVPEGDGPTEAPTQADDPIASLFTASRAQFAEPSARAGGGLFLFVTLLFFVFSVGPGATPTSVAILVGVLAFHELGHYAGMRVFGYRDVRMFFVPFLGAAVSGRRGNVAAWKDAVVLLLGPVPGVILGTGVMIATVRWPIPALVELGETLLLVNAFNLLPFGALDGGRLLLRVIFARHRYLELGFAGLGAVALGLTALALGSYALGLFAFFGLAGLGRRARLLAAAAAVRPSMGDASAANLDEDATRRLFDEARAAVAPPLSGDPRAIGTAMEDILLAAQRPPGVLASTLLVGIWAGTWLVALVSAIGLAHALAPAEWERHAFAGFSIELPDDPSHLEESWSTPVGPRPAQIERTSLDIVERFTVIELDAGADIAAADRDAWLATARARLDHDLSAQGASVVSEREVQVGGRPGVEIEWRNAWRTWHSRTLVAGRHVFSIIASSPDGAAHAARFLDSFALVESAP